MSLAVKVENLGKRYRLGEIGRKTFFADLKRKLMGKSSEQNGENFWALKNITFDVPQGEVLAVVGHNGAGKSTLLKILSSITSPTCGSVKLRGRVASLLEVGTGFHQELTGRDNVFLNGAILGMSHREIAAKYDEIVAFSEVGEFIDTPVKRYSSGMRVRLAFAVAAHLEPEILIIDEVLAVGDAAFQQRCIGKMGEVSKSGRTVIFVSHNPAAVENLCKRGIVLNKGELVFDGTQTEALRYYANRHSGAVMSDLRSRTDRTGSGEVRFTKIEIKDTSGEPTGAVRLGEDVEVHLEIERLGEVLYPRMCIEIIVCTSLGAPVFSQSNFYTGTMFGNLPDKATIICRIPKLPLLDGKYQIEAGLYPMYRQREPLDVIRNAAELNVMRGDFFGGGKLPAASDGLLLVPAQWWMQNP